MPALLDIINNMPVVEEQIEQARQSILRQIETERIIPKRLYWTARGIFDLGYHHDIRRDIYDRLSRDGRNGLIQFHEQHIRNRHFTFLLLGNKSSLDRKFLEQFGEVEELRMEEVFGY